MSPFSCLAVSRDQKGYRPRRLLSIGTPSTEDRLGTDVQLRRDAWGSARKDQIEVRSRTFLEESV